MKENKIIVAGIGPGSPEDITPAVVNALKESDLSLIHIYRMSGRLPNLCKQ